MASKHKKTERLHIRTSPEMKRTLQEHADLYFGGNVNKLVDVALELYLSKDSEDNE